ncbi:hypothetical protein SISNIDRAFT_198370 [Sistotremastrum niveocremeum HHB9708]|uniref:Uncharacterized protein n=1 Tax=Sistotremastrum niveocremeum HHB9708 TaxID=1314777 RepID=A0A164ZLV1_9AGAM|nr:hypothetical protein SISNIDRAFT_198370 [Sistotremastrum niveocremeum HHB9708]
MLLDMLWCNITRALGRWVILNIIRGYRLWYPVVSGYYLYFLPDHLRSRIRVLKLDLLRLLRRAGAIQEAVRMRIVWIILSWRAIGLVMRLLMRLLMRLRRLRERLWRRLPCVVLRGLLAGLLNGLLNRLLNRMRQLLLHAEPVKVLVLTLLLSLTLIMIKWRLLEIMIRLVRACDRGRVIRTARLSRRTSHRTIVPWNFFDSR